MSRFRVQIVDTVTGEAAQLRPGSQGERDLLADMKAAVLKRGVGFFRTEAHVAEALAEGLHEALLALKKDVQPPPVRPDGE